VSITDFFEKKKIYPKLVNSSFCLVICFLFCLLKTEKKKVIFLSFIIFTKGQQVVNDYTHKIVVKEDGTQSMIVVPAMPQDSGEWTVVAQNRAGKTTVSMTLTVEGKPFFFFFFQLYLI